MFQSNTLPLNRRIDSNFDYQKLVKNAIFKTPKLYKKSSQVYNLSSAQVFKSFTMGLIINEVPSKKISWKFEILRQYFPRFTVLNCLRVQKG